ncbi:hypothetical protein [Tautonia sociabilis]|uniref:hypothetical protein n=1 Tax=Tautonia sociabilis TaxID=2080755 RepID=UPI0018F51E07|nr:hypothetical protein [Tautonia sociabilis]
MSGPDPIAEIDPDAIRDPLSRLYQELDARIAEAGPVCLVSGRCCRFREYGHTLFLSAAEAALLVADAPPPARDPDGGDLCPWQDDAGRCTARGARPLGCRVYFCDPNYDGRAEPLTEEFLGKLRRLADERGLPWGYAPLHRHLADAVAAGLLGGHRPLDRPTARLVSANGREALDISPSDQ